ncbi:hypothetical protein Leryth_002708 [Lithospermum erythrorhizon]|nr:hypothetical protein Leryth_002708 [Lithospermum erythrorhizon]
MGLPRRAFWCLIPFLFASIILESFPVAKCAPEYTTLVYKGCAHQSLSDPTGIGQNIVTGLFQCRAARLQLYGCYMLYEVNGFPQISGMELLYKTCSGKNAGGSGAEQVRDTALNALENGISSANGGFYTTSYQSVYVLGQCEGDVGASDCGECVKNAVQKAQFECGSSISGQIYLHKCFISYSYYPHGPPKRSSSSSYSAPSSGSSGQSTGKTLAIILGGAAAVGFLVILLLFVRSLVKKHDDF